MSFNFSTSERHFLRPVALPVWRAIPQPHASEIRSEQDSSKWEPLAAGPGAHAPRALSGS